MTDKNSERIDYTDNKFRDNFGDNISADFDWMYAVDINGAAMKDGLKFTFAYNKHEFDRSSVETFADCFKNNLRRLANHCTKKKKEILATGKSTMDYHAQKDYEKYLKQVEEEKWPDLSETKEYRHVLLTGATGFMGGYVVHEFFDKTDAVLYLPVRGASQEDAEKRTAEKLGYYFGEDFYQKNKDRLIVLKADLAEEKMGLSDSQYQEWADVVEAVVHPAANVRHHGLYEELYKDNVLATERLLEFSVIGKKKDFHYVSTVDVGLGNIPGREHMVYTEYHHDVGQDIDHIYLKSKFEAEKKVLEYREKGINGCIYRVGNLIFHSDTGTFQTDIGKDYFYAIIKGAIKLELYSEQMQTMLFDMSFIDYIARSTVLLATRANLKNETYHLCNPYEYPMPDMISELKKMGYTFNDVEQDKVDEYLKRFDGNEEYEKIIELLKLHSWIFQPREGTVIMPKLDRTVKLLEKMDFEWPTVNQKHVKIMIEHCKNVGFL